MRSGNHSCSGRAILVPILSVCLSNAHALCCHMWLVHLYSIFPHCNINGTIFFLKKVIGHKMCVLIFCTVLSKTFDMIYNMIYDICVYI
jgi:hypothetical protein